MVSKFNYQSLCIIIPMFNEEKGAAICIDKVLQELKKINISAKLLVVNDGSTDKTRVVLDKKIEQDKKYLLVIHHEKNQGYGKALQTGIQEAAKHKFTYVLFMDSDLTNNPIYIKEFAKYMEKDIDCIKASRYIKGGKVIGVPFFRWIISRISNMITMIFFGITDCTNGFRMVRLKFLENIRFKENSFSIIMEEMYYLKKRHARFAEIPVTLTARKNTTSHFVYRPKTFYDYAKYVIKAFLYL